MFQRFSHHIDQMLINFLVVRGGGEDGRRKGEKRGGRGYDWRGEVASNFCTKKFELFGCQKIVTLVTSSLFLCTDVCICVCICLCMCEYVCLFVCSFHVDVYCMGIHEFLYHSYIFAYRYPKLCETYSQIMIPMHIHRNHLQIPGVGS